MSLKEILTRDDVPLEVKEIIRKEMNNYNNIRRRLKRKDERMELAITATGLGIWDRDIRTWVVERNEQTARLMTIQMN